MARAPLALSFLHQIVFLSRWAPDAPLSVCSQIGRRATLAPRFGPQFACVGPFFASARSASSDQLGPLGAGALHKLAAGAAYRAPHHHSKSAPTRAAELAAYLASSARASKIKRA